MSEFSNATLKSSINSKEGGWKEKKSSKPREIKHKPPGPSSSWERGFNGDKINLDSTDHSTSCRTWAKVCCYVNALCCWLCISLCNDLCCCHCSCKRTSKRKYEINEPKNESEEKVVHISSYDENGVIITSTNSDLLLNTAPSNAK